MYVLFAVAWGTPSPSLAAFSSDASSSSLPALDTCEGQVEDQLSFLHEQYRDVVYGKPTADDAGVNTVREDREGNQWVKGAGGSWLAADGRVKTGPEIDKISLLPPRRGIFEAREALTSDLVPSLTQAYRGFTCAAAAACENTRYSTQQIEANVRPDGLLSIESPGCQPILLKPLRACGQLWTQSLPSESLGLGFCTQTANAMLDREADTLRMSVSYDAGYRSLLQFSGTFDTFLLQFKGDLLTPIEQTTSLIGQLSRIPCFLAECNE